MKGAAIAASGSRGTNSGFRRHAISPQDRKRQFRRAVVGVRFLALPFEGREQASGSLWHAAVCAETLNITGRGGCEPKLCAQAAWFCDPWWALSLAAVGFCLRFRQ